MVVDTGQKLKKDVVDLEKVEKSNQNDTEYEAVAISRETKKRLGLFSVERGRLGRGSMVEVCGIETVVDNVNGELLFTSSRIPELRVPTEIRRRRV